MYLIAKIAKTGKYCITRLEVSLKLTSSKNKDNKPQIAIYQSLGDGQKIRVRIEDVNVWLKQKLIAELFAVDVRTVNEHLTNIYLELELEENPTIRNFRIVQKEGSREIARDVKYYNLDAILKEVNWLQIVTG